MNESHLVHANLVPDKYLAEVQLGSTPDADHVDAGYPQDISVKWGIPGPIDAIFERSSNGKIYIFKGDQYWRLSDKYLNSELDPSGPDPIDEGYPLKIADKFFGTSPPFFLGVRS